MNRISHWVDGKVLEGNSGRTGIVWDPATGQQASVVDLASAVEFSPALDSVLNRANMSITEEGDTVVITLPAITITIKQNR